MLYLFKKMLPLLCASVALTLLLCFPTAALADEVRLTPAEEEAKIANLLFNNKQYAAAESHMAAAIRLNPSEPGYRWLHGTCLMHIGRYKEAADDLKLSCTARDSPGHRSMVMQEVAKCYAEMHDWPNALRAYEDLSRMADSRYDPYVMNDLARIYGMAGMNEKSLAERKWALRYGWAEHDPVSFQCNMLSLSNKDRALAIGEYAESKGDRNSSLMLIMATLHLQKGQFDRALKEIAPCCATADLCALNWGLKGEIEFQEGRYVEAINDLNTAIKLPICPTMLLGKTPEDQVLEWENARTDCYVKLKKYSDALKSVNLSIATKAGMYKPGLYIVKGMIEYWMKSYDRAVVDFSKAIENESSHPTSMEYQARAGVYYLIDNLAAARTDFEKANSLDSNNSDICFFLSVVDMRQQEFAKAIDHLTDAIKRDLNKQQSLYFERRADAHFQAAEYSAAIDDYSAAIAIETTNPWLFAGRALAYAKAEMPEKKNADLAAMEALQKKPSVNNTTNKSAIFFDKSSSIAREFSRKNISDRRNQILADASKLKPASQPALKPHLSPSLAK